MLVTPDGHDPEAYSDFISMEKAVDDVASWLKSHRIARPDAIYGLSFGGLLATLPDQARFDAFEKRCYPLVAASADCDDEWEWLVGVWPSQKMA